MPTFDGGLARARTLARDCFGHTTLRLHQLKVLGPLLSGRSVIAVLPTGAGKSLCYQLPALMTDGLTLVLSPLVALMQDQVGKLRERTLPAVYVNSLLEPAERAAALNAVYTKRATTLYCAPERLESLIPALNTHHVRVSFLAVDEAHCITAWGGEFRTAYRELGRYRYLLGDPVTLAVTGTATAATRTEIAAVLRIPHADVIVTSFDRPKLRFTVERVADDRQRFRRVRELMRSAGGQGIVYAPTRRLAELVSRALRRSGFHAAPYHAGLPAEARRDVLTAFLGDELPIVVGTTAFGMGIDKANVRRVVHWGPSRSLEAYYQEAGRAGRDGRHALCTVLWRPADLAHTATDPAMKRFLTGHGCRRRTLLGYFGESLGRCSGCDRCGLPD